MHVKLDMRTEVSLDVCISKLGALPPGVTSLSITGTHLHCLTSREGKQLVHLIKVIPLTVTELDASFCQFGKFPTEDLVCALQSLPQKLERLNLAGNWLYLQAAHFERVFEALNPQLQGLYLGSNELFRCPDGSFETLCAVIPAELTYLNVEANGLGSRYSTDEITRGLNLIERIATLDFGGNELFYKSLEDQKRISAVGRQGRQSFKLEGNKFGFTLFPTVSESDDSSTSRDSWRLSL